MTKLNKKFAERTRLRKREQNAIGAVAEMLIKKREKQARKTMTIRPMTSTFCKEQAMEKRMCLSKKMKSLLLKGLAYWKKWNKMAKNNKIKGWRRTRKVQRFRALGNSATMQMTMSMK